MSVLPAGFGGSGDYLIEESLRFNASQSSYLSRTPASAGNQNIWTLSAWIKRGALGARLIYNTAASIGSNTLLGQIYFDTNNKLSVFQYTSSTIYTNLVTTQVFRDLSSWYHIVVIYDDPQATTANRIKIYVNGVQVTAFDTASYPTQNFNGFFNAAQPTSFGRDYQTGPMSYLDGYLTEVNFIDGQALTPSSFGEFDNTTGVWKPKKYTGTYGTNGFFLNFSDATSATTLGYDYSGNSNNWTLNSFNTTPTNALYCSMTDTPTPYFGGGNYAVLSPIDQVGGRALTTSNGNLNFTGTYGESKSSIQLPESGKYYFEYVWTAIASTPAQFIAGIAGYQSDGQKSTGGAWSAYGASWTTNDVIGAAVDMDAKTVTFYKNGVSQGSISSPSYSNRDIFTTSNGSAATNSGYANFGQRPFAYTPPTGFKALHTGNLPDSTIVDGSKYFDVALYTGNASTQSITSLDFQPDFVWMKSRGRAVDHALYDAVRGVEKRLETNNTDAEVTGDTTGLTAFNAAGWTMGALDQINGTTATNSFVGWAWKASNAAGVSNTAGTITSTVSANTTAGFSIVTYTGTGANATVGHGLGVAPKMVIIKNRGSIVSWRVGHASQASPWVNVLYLDTTTGNASETQVFNGTAPTSTVFSVGTSAASNENTKAHVAYCFADVPGFSKFGSYTGNGSADGPFIYCGFKPKWILYKRTDSTSHWGCIDGARNPYNLANLYFLVNTANAEVANTMAVDFVSNGFKVRTADGGQNTSGATYIYAAFAENPFKNSLAR